MNRIAFFRAFSACLCFSAALAFGDPNGPDSADWRLMSRRVASLEAYTNDARAWVVLPSGATTSAPMRGLRFLPVGSTEFSLSAPGPLPTVAIAAGGGGGSGFPLTNAANAGGLFPVTNLAGIGFAGSTDLVERVDGALWYGGLRLGSITNFGWGLAGSGTTNPLSVDPTVFVNTNLGFGLIGSGLEGDPVRVDQDQVVFQPAADRLPGAYLAWDGSNWVSTYSVRASVDYAAWLSSVGVAAPATTNSVPGTLVSSAGTTYMLKKNLDHADYFATYGNVAPGLLDSTWWLSFAARGAQGVAGQPGDDGLDGVGQVLYGAWDPSKEYVYDANAIPLVSYGGQLFAALASSTGQIPANATSYWSVAVAKGVDAELVGATNLVYRGTWATLGTYASNDVVYWKGNMFVVTTNDPPGGVAPGVDADYVGANSFYWDVLVAKGERGATGLQGDDGAVTYVTNLFYLYGSDVAFYQATNEPAGRDDILYYSGSSGTNELLRWGPSPTAALTNLLSASYRRVWPAEVSGTAVTLRPESNFMWRLDTAADAVASWNLAVPGRATNEVAVLGLETFRAESNSWTWMSGLTNAPPVVGQTNLFLLFLPEGSANWMIY